MFVPYKEKNTNISDTTKLTEQEDYKPQDSTLYVTLP
jgi:hypothetical protein